MSSSAGGLKYKGVWDYSTGVLPNDIAVGDFFKISVEGDYNGLHLMVGDMLIANAVVGGESIASNWDVISNTVTESDPVFVASIAAGISALQIVHRDEAYSRGNHALMGYLTSESDPIRVLEKSNYYTKSEVDNKNYLTQEQDPEWNSAKTNYYTKYQIDTKGYITGYNESDPEWNAVKNNYYTTGQVAALLDGLSIGNHTHDERYYTSGQVDALLNTKSTVGHTHSQYLT